MDDSSKKGVSDKKFSDEPKHFVDTIKLIAYRAETAPVQVVWEKRAR